MIYLMLSISNQPLSDMQVSLRPMLIIAIYYENLNEVRIKINSDKINSDKINADKINADKINM